MFSVYSLFIRYYIITVGILCNNCGYSLLLLDQVKWYIIPLDCQEAHVLCVTWISFPMVFCHKVEFSDSTAMAAFFEYYVRVVRTSSPSSISN